MLLVRQRSAVIVPIDLLQLGRLVGVLILVLLDLLQLGRFVVAVVIGVFAEFAAILVALEPLLRVLEPAIIGVLGEVTIDAVEPLLTRDLGIAGLRAGGTERADDESRSRADEEPCPCSHDPSYWKKGVEHGFNALQLNDR